MTAFEDAIAEFEINSDAQAITILDREHKYIINISAKGTGKTRTHPIWALERGTFDTGQIHGVFTNTDRQMKDAVFVELFEQLPRYGVKCDYGCKPPKGWVRRWEDDGVPYPKLKDYRGIFYTSQALHAVCGTLFNQSYTQFESLQFASLRIEEITALSKQALKAILSRLRCGKGKHRPDRPKCDCCSCSGHRHQAHMFGNPPVGGAHPWLFDWLDQYEEGALKLYHVLEDGESCDGCHYVTREGRSLPREHGPQLNHRQWPLLRQGLGNAILIKARTSDNRENLNEGYEDDIAMNSDKATADAWLGGELTREQSAGCYAADFSDANIRDVKYDPTRTLLVGIDINIEPRVAVLAHVLRPGEYPDDWHQPGVEQLGIFGEFFSRDGMSDRNFAEAMMRGGRGTGDAGYPDELRGLPANWAGLSTHMGPIIFYGDAEGNRRSVHADNLESSWIILKQVFGGKIANATIPGLAKWSCDIPDNNPPARARIHSVCAKLRSFVGKPSLSIAKRCRHSVKDCETVVWDENGLAEREWRHGEEMLRTHCMAGAGYMIYARSPYGKDADRDPRRGLPAYGKSSIKVPRTRV